MIFSITHLLVPWTSPHCYLRGHSAADMSDSEQQGALTSFKSGLHQRLKAPKYRLNNRETPAVTLFLQSVFIIFWKKKQTFETFARPTFCVEMILHYAACGTLIYDIYLHQKEQQKKNKNPKPNRISWAAVLENLMTKTDWNAANISDRGCRKFWCRQCSNDLNGRKKITQSSLIVQHLPNSQEDPSY